jgi:hypothetical protein
VFIQYLDITVIYILSAMWKGGDFYKAKEAQAMRRNKKIPQRRIWR